MCSGICSICCVADYRKIQTGAYFLRLLRAPNLGHRLPKTHVLKVKPTPASIIKQNGTNVWSRWSDSSGWVNMIWNWYIHLEFLNRNSSNTFLSQARDLYKRGQNKILVYTHRNTHASKCKIILYIHLRNASRHACTDQLIWERGPVTNIWARYRWEVAFYARLDVLYTHTHIHTPCVLYDTNSVELSTTREARSCAATR
jgi:hypothetical protein